MLQKKRQRSFFRAFIKTCMGHIGCLWIRDQIYTSVILNTHRQPTTCHSTPKEKNNIQTYNLTWLHPLLEINYMFIWNVTTSASFPVAREVRETLFRHLNHKMKPTFFTEIALNFSSWKKLPFQARLLSVERSNITSPFIGQFFSLQYLNQSKVLY